MLILAASLSGSSATFGWLADLFGVGSKHYGPGFGGSGSPFGIGANRHRPRPFGTTHGGGYVGGNGASPGGSEYLGGGWTGSGNAGYSNYYGNSGGFLNNLGLGGGGGGLNPFFGGNHLGHQIHRYGQNGIGGP